LSPLCDQKGTWRPSKDPAAAGVGASTGLPGAVPALLRRPLPLQVGALSKRGQCWPIGDSPMSTHREYADSYGFLTMPDEDAGGRMRRRASASLLTATVQRSCERY
jgi:hypothetical protein